MKAEGGPTMIKTRRFILAIIAALTFVVIGVGGIDVRDARAAETAANDCLVAIQNSDGETITTDQSCTDGDACDADGATNGECAFHIRGAVNVPDPACQARPIKKVKFKAPHSKDKVVVTPISGQASSVFGSFIDLHVKLKKKGKKAGFRQLIATAQADVKPRGKNKDKDKVRFTCNVCPTASCVPPSTTTTVTTTTVPATSTTLPCGNGAIDTGETCDPDAVPNGCSGGTPFCNTGCTACQANCSQLAFTLGAPTLDCGFPGQGVDAAPPLTGELRDGTDTKITPGGDLGSACLYIGGGIASIVPPGPTPNGSTTLIGIADCSVNNVTLVPADTGNPATCTVGPKTSKHCTNGHPGTDNNGTCTQDSDCAPVCVNGHCVDGAGGTDGNGACTGNQNCGASSAGGPPVNVCQADPSCYFGNPLPIENGGTSTCVLNVVDTGVTGTADVAAGSASATLPLRSWVYLTGLEADFSGGIPCPICDNGTCNAGERKGLACTTNSLLKTTLDCPPPDHLFLAPLAVTLGPLTTGPAVLTSDVNGIFCPAQGNGGAFGVTTARKIIENGSAGVGGFSVTGTPTTLASVFCIPATNNLLIDGAANLPGPGATGLAGSARLR
jgi:hypothetical protein